MNEFQHLLQLVERFDFKKDYAKLAQQQMHIAGRVMQPQSSTYRKASVLIVLYQDKEKVKLILTLRHNYKGVHANQIGLPGGKVEVFDTSLQKTALRETQEEVGIEEKDIAIVGRLSPIYIEPSDFMVHPFMGILKTAPIFKPNTREVKEIIPVDFFNFVKNPILHNEKRLIRGESITVRGFKVANNHFVWGATAMILLEMIHIVRKSLNLPSLKI